MKFAWIENDTIRDLCSGDPNELYHPDVALHYTVEVPDNAENGDKWVNGILEKPPVLASSTATALPVYPKVSPVEFKLLFTVQERVAIKTARQTDPLIADFYEILDDPRLTHVDLGLQSTQDGVHYLESINLLSVGRATEILTGVFR